MYGRGGSVIFLSKVWVSYFLLVRLWTLIMLPVDLFLSSMQTNQTIWIWCGCKSSTLFSILNLIPWLWTLKKIIVDLSIGFTRVNVFVTRGHLLFSYELYYTTNYGMYIVTQFLHVLKSLLFSLKSSLV